MRPAAVCDSGLRQRVWFTVVFDKTYSHTHWRTTVQVRRQVRSPLSPLLWRAILTVHVPPFTRIPPECGKEFVQRCTLKRHEQTHNNAKQWNCPHPDCGKKFKLKEYLDVHSRTHMKLEASAAPAAIDSSDLAIRAGSCKPTNVDGAEGDSTEGILV